MMQIKFWIFPHTKLNRCISFSMGVERKEWYENVKRSSDIRKLSTQHEVFKDYFFCYSENWWSSPHRHLFIFMIHNISEKGIKTMFNLNGIIKTNPLRSIVFFLGTKKNLLKLDHKTFGNSKRKHYKTFQYARTKTSR